MHYSSKTFACPYFTNDKKLCVCCKGGNVRFKDKKHEAEFTERFCANNPGWSQCSLAASLNKYHERKGT